MIIRHPDDVTRAVLSGIGRAPAKRTVAAISFDFSFSLASDWSKLTISTLMFSVPKMRSQPIAVELFFLKQLTFWPSRSFKVLNCFCARIWNSALASLAM